MADWAAAGQAQCYHSLLTSSERLSQNWWPKLFFIFPTFLFIFCYVRQFMNRWQIARYGYWVWVESLRICCHLFSPQSLEDSIRDPCLFHFFILFFSFFFFLFSFIYLFFCFMYLMSETFCGLGPGIASCADIAYNDDVGIHLTLLIVLLLLFIDHKVLC